MKYYFNDDFHFTYFSIKLQPNEGNISWIKNKTNHDYQRMYHLMVVISKLKHKIYILCIQSHEEHYQRWSDRKADRFVQLVKYVVKIYFLLSSHFNNQKFSNKLLYIMKSFKEKTINK